MKALLGTQHTVEWIVLGATLVVGLATVSMATGYGITSTPGVGAGFLPLVGGIGMIAGGAMWAIQMVRAPRTTATAQQPELQPATSAAVAFLSSDNEEDGDETEMPDRAGWIRIAVVVAAIAGAALVLPTLGYTLSMALMLAVVLTFVGKRTPLVAIAVAVAVATTLATRLVFDVWLGTALPSSSIALLADWGL